MTIAAHGPGGMPSRNTSSFTTVTPDYQTEVYLDTVGGTPIQGGGTYGVGTVVVARFDEPVENKTNAERHHVVTTTPPVHGRGTGSTTRPRIGDLRSTTPQALR